MKTGIPEQKPILISVIATAFFHLFLSPVNSVVLSAFSNERTAAEVTLAENVTGNSQEQLHMQCSDCYGSDRATAQLYHTGERMLMK